MEEVKNFAQNGSPESSPTSVLPSLRDDDDDDHHHTFISTSVNPDDNDNKESPIALPNTSMMKITVDDDGELCAPEDVVPIALPDTSKSVTLDDEEESYVPEDAPVTPMDSHIHQTVTESNYPSTSLQPPDPSPNYSPQDYDIPDQFHVEVEPNDVTEPQLADEQTSQQDTDDSDVATPRNDEEPTDAKIVARPTLDDDPISSPSTRHKRSDSMDQIVAKVPSNYFSRAQPGKPFKAMKNIDLTKVQIDTTAPFESVKEAASKFGEISYWKANRLQTMERRRFIEQKLKKVQEEIQSYKQQLEVAEETKVQFLQELNDTESQIEELKLKLQTTLKEEEQSNHAAVLTKLRVDEIEQEIADDASFTAKEQFEFAQAKHAAALEELNTAKDVLEQTRKEYALLLAEKDEAAKKAEEAEAASKEAQKSIKEMTVELRTLKQSLEAANSEDPVVINRRLEEYIKKDLEALVWEKEANLAKDELEKLNEQMLPTKDVRSRLREATTLLQDKKAEMEVYMESKSGTEVTLEDIILEPEKSSHKDVETAITAAKKELTEVEETIEKAAGEVNILKASAATLKSELDRENFGLADAQKRERTALNAVRFLEAELNTVKSEITLVRMKKAGEKDETGDLPKRLQEAAQEADQAKSLAQTARAELEKAKEETEAAKAGASVMECRLNEAQREIEDAKVSERLAIAAINKLAKSNSFKRIDNQDTPDEIAIPIEEYYELTKKVYEAEEAAKSKVAAAVSQVEAAKQAESRSLNRLEEVTREIARQTEALKEALQKAEKAEEGKLAVEQELRKWKNEQEQNRCKDVEPACAPLSVLVLEPVEPVPVLVPVLVSSPRVKSQTSPSSLQISKSFFNPTCGLHLRSSKRPFTRVKTVTETELSTDTRIVPRKKKKLSFFPRFFMFLFGKKLTSYNKAA